MPPPRPRIQFLPIAVMLALSVEGCATVDAFLDGRNQNSATTQADAENAASVSVEKVDLFRRAETERAADLTREIARLQADLRKAEAALIEAESGLAGTHTRADAVSSLAVARIQVERAASRTPWRRDVIQDARDKLAEAEDQVAENRFGAALFFVYRAQRVAESLLEEADLVERSGNARVIHARRVNLRGGPSMDTPILSVLEAGTPVFPRAQQGEWILMQVSGGPTGWIHRNLVGRHILGDGTPPASPAP